jgi:hypothetical protein
MAFVKYCQVYPMESSAKNCATCLAALRRREGSLIFNGESGDLRHYVIAKRGKVGYIFSAYNMEQRVRELVFYQIMR